MPLIAVPTPSVALTGVVGTVLLASSTAVTLIVTVAEAEVSSPPSAVPPLFCTANEKRARPAFPNYWPLACRASLPWAMSPAATAWPAVTAKPLSAIVPVVGNDSMITALRAVGGTLFGSA